MTRSRRIVRFGEFEIDRDARELHRSGQRVPLQVQPFLVLEILVDREGGVVTREELRAKVWPATVYVDFDHGLNNAITRLRRALDDSVDSPRYLQTLPRLGYRFIHPVEKYDSPPRTGWSLGMGRGPLRLALAATLAIGIVAIGFGAMRWFGDAASGRGVRADASLSANAEARDAYRRGKELFEQRRKESTELSIEYLERATALDPSFADAYAQLAMAYALAGGNSLVHYRSQSEVVAPALAAAHRALQLNPSLPQAHVALADVLNSLLPWSAVNDEVIEHSYLRALELEAGNTDAHLFFGNFLSTRGHIDEAVRQFELAVESSPLSPSANSRLGAELIAVGKTDQGLDYLRKTVALNPWQFNAQVRLGWGYLALDDLDAAERAFETAETISPNSLQSTAGLAVSAARRGDETTARALLQTLLPLADAADNPFEVAMVYVALEETDLSLEWLGRAVRATRALHMPGYWGIRSPIYDWLRADPRFAEIEREIAATARPSDRPSSAPRSPPAA